MSDNQAQIVKMAQLLQPKVPKQRVISNSDPDGTEISKPPTTIRVVPVCWAFPMDEIVFTRWVTNLLMLRLMPWDDIITISNTYVPDARNKLHNQFMSASSADWLIMLDSDVCPPPDFIERLLKHHKQDPRKKMLGGWYRKKGEPFEPVVYEYSGLHPDGKTHNYRNYEVDEIQPAGLERVDGAGAGCWLMHREVAEAIGESPYDMSEGGEDLLLCRKVQDAGYDIYIDWSIACAHVGVGLV